MYIDVTTMASQSHASTCRRETFRCLKYVCDMVYFYEGKRFPNFISPHVRGLARTTNILPCDQHLTGLEPLFNIADIAEYPGLSRM
jgi:hypothetical protein